MKLAGIILAAGASRRMGAHKALLDFQGETFLERQIRLFSAACDPVIVVLGHNADRIRSALRPGPSAVFVINPDYTRGMLSSLQCGLAAVPGEADGVMFTPVDYPAIRPATVAALAAQFARLAPGQYLVIPRCQARHGHPVCLTREVLQEILDLPPEASARDLVRRRRGNTCYLDVDDPGILDDADDPEAYRRLLEAARSS